MSKPELIAYIKKNIRRLEREQKKLQRELDKSSGKKVHTSITYVISRKHTLLEILELI